MSRRIDRVAARLEPPFPPEVAELIARLDDLAPDDERETESDCEPSGDEMEPELAGWSAQYGEAGVTVPFELDQTERRIG